MSEPSLKDLARRIFEQSLEDCSVERAFAEKVTTYRQGNDTVLLFGEHAVHVSRLTHLRVVAVGKAAESMLSALLKRLPLTEPCEMSGVVIGPDSAPEPSFKAFPGGHPFPNAASFAGAQAVLQMLRDVPKDATQENTLCLFLVSGGASAMMELPLDPTITLEETSAFHRVLVHSGASIAEINCVRKHFSAVKGGRLARAASRVACLSILLSDVPPGNLDTIASGPTLPDRSTSEECREILLRYGMLDRFPASVRRFFLSPEMPETVKPSELVARTWAILSSDDLAEAARQHAERLGFNTVVDNTCDDWDYRAAADYLLDRVRALRREHRRVCLISVGELIVRPTESHDHESAIVSGNGGRNQHFALYMATTLQNSRAAVTVLSAGSDGIDGHSRAAGAVIDERTLALESDGQADKGSLRGLAETALREFQSSSFLERVNATIVTGPTGNNLRDLRILLSEAPA